jgi:MoxR-like ATPase
MKDLLFLHSIRHIYNPIKNMKRTDFIQTREDIIANIKTLYSYLNGDFGDDYKAWAVDKMKRGHNFVVEIIDGKVCFAPSRFVGYLNNTKEKHEQNHGDGTQTDDQIKAYYKLYVDNRLDELFQKETSKFGVFSGNKKYWLLDGVTVEDIISFDKTNNQTRGNMDLYWHIQMHLPEGKGGMEIDSVKMLKEKEPVIGTGEWSHSQCVNFKTIDKGSIVMVRRGSQAIALCEIIGDNFQDKRLENKYYNVNYRKVRILGWAVDYKQPRAGLFSQGTFSSCKAYTEQYKYIDGWVNFLKGRAFVERCTKLLKTKRNIILQGAPGTGKTYNTAAIALNTLGITGVDLSTHDKVMKCYDSLLESQIFFTTFHQSLDYEDFVEGLKPRVRTDKDGNVVGIEYETVDGIFKRACQAVENDETKDNAKKNKPVVLIIDEINRGNVSKIFGELITLLESDKRDNPDHTGHPIKVTLPYSQTLFGVPSNLYIIGTMNTTDRSTGTLDYALRRRFAFVTLKSDVMVIEKHYDALGNVALKGKAVSLFNDIRKFISDPSHLTGDYSIDDLMVGHSYFMADSEEDLSNRIEYEVLPLIAEYINDGILSVKSCEKELAFNAWRNLEPIAEVEEEEQ